MSLFKPDDIVSSVAAIDLDALVEAGIRGLFVDLDNTLLSRENSEVPDFVMEWLGRAKQSDLKICLVSNNWHSTVFAVAERLGLPIIHKSMKPFPLAYMIARKRMGLKARESVGIGDQLMTDVLGSHLSGMKAIMVLPLAAKDLPHTLFLRRFERLLMGGDPKPRV